DAWERTSHSEPLRECLRVRIDDPFYPISAMLFPDTRGRTAHLALPHRTLTRKRQEEEGGLGKSGDGPGQNRPAIHPDFCTAHSISGEWHCAKLRQTP
ncbi:MAG: hypothetical protein P8Y48_14055, partial [Novosphingobium sp.]